MCLECYEDAGRPKIINDKVLELIELIKEVYEFASAGGGLHIVLDDWNTDKECVLWYLEYIMDLTRYITEDERKIELKCYNKLLECSEEEIDTALAIHEGFLIFDEKNKTYKYFDEKEKKND